MANEGIITNVGLVDYATHVTDTYDFMAIGSGTTALLGSQTALISELIRQASTNTTTGTPASNGHFESLFTMVADVTVSEVGLFDAAADGNMYYRGLFAGVPLYIGDNIKIEIDVNHGNA